MKTLSFFVALLVFVCLLPAATAQTSLWGLLPEGGSGRKGAIFSVDTPGAGHRVVSSFEITHPGLAPQAGLLSRNGLLWGVTLLGGQHDQGLLFSYDPQSGDYMPRHHFREPGGSEPDGGLLLARDGLLYGLCRKGGSYGAGVLYTFDPQTGSYAVRHHFLPLQGQSPWGTLLELSDGRLLGVTQGGGSQGGGVLFSFYPPAQQFSRLWDFTGSNGQLPGKGLERATDGRCVGVTLLGGRNGKGVLFAFDPADSVMQLLHHFGDLPFDGAGPGAAPVLLDGAFWGTTWQGGQYGDGVLYRFDTLSHSLTLPHHFSSAEGSSPRGGLRIQNHTLYGLAYRGGMQDLGCLFSYTPGSASYQVLHHFTGPEGSYPYAPVTFHQGMWYGLASQGGQSRSGTLFAFSPLTGILQPALHFSMALDGATPSGLLLAAPDGWLYGMASSGGRFGHGVLFRLNPASGVREKLHDFATEGEGEGLALGVNGHFYGLLQQNTGPGLLFEWNPHAGTYRQVWVFSDSTGTHPAGRLASGQDGRLWGYTTRGGRENLGTLFAFDPIPDTLEVWHAFSPSTGFAPEGSALEASDGHLYGVTSRGGPNPLGGVLFRFDRNNLTYSIVTAFQDAQTGLRPVGGLVEALVGKLMGVTLEGGQQGLGTLYSLPLTGNQLGILHHFEPVTGAYPVGNLWAAGSRLWGLTAAGGQHDLGTVFSYDLLGDRYQKQADFDSLSGRPGPGLSGWQTATGREAILPALSLRVYPNPASRQCWIEGGSQSQGVFHLQLCDLQGRGLIHKSWHANGAFRYPLLLDGLPAGTYLMKVSCSGQQQNLLLLIR